MKKTPKITSYGNHCWHALGVWSNVDEKCERLSEYIHCRNCPVFSDEGKRVFNRAAPVGYLKDWRKALATKKSEDKADSKSILIFRVNNEWFALPADCLHEITEKRTIHRIPRNINNDISGVVNVGGEVRICYSLESILGVKRLSDEIVEEGVVATGRFIVAFLDGQYYVFYVEQISGLSWYRDKELLSVPATIGHENEDMLLGVISHNKNKVAVLDTEKFQRNLEGIRL